MEEGAREYFRKLDAMGGMLNAIERGFPQREILEASQRYQREIDRKERIIVGVNEYLEPDQRPIRHPANRTGSRNSIRGNDYSHCAPDGIPRK